MRAVRFTKAEALALHDAGHHADSTGHGSKALSMALEKLVAAEAPAEKGVAAGPLEEALVRTSRGKVVELVSGPGAYGRASKMATALGATVADAEVLGAWLARQGWLREPTTLLGVLNKWAEWLPRARATAPPPAAPEGFDGTGDTGQGAGRPGQRGGGRGGAPGFG